MNNTDLNQYMDFLVNNVIPVEPKLNTYFQGNLYHYTSLYSLEQILKNKTLRLTKSDFLNDRKEMIHSLDLLNEIFNNNQWEYIHYNLFKKITKIVKESISNSFILSLSHNPDSLALWGIYSSFEGYNINFNFSQFYSDIWNGRIYLISKENKNDVYFQIKDCEFSFFTGDVVYDITTQRDILYKLLMAIDDVYQRFPNKDMYFTKSLDRILNLMAIYILLFKNPSFQQEEEHRLIITLREYSNDLVHYRTSNGVFIPFIEIGFAENLPIDSIGIGPKNNMDIAVHGLKMYLSSLDYSLGNKKKPIKISKSRIPLRY